MFGSTRCFPQDIPKGGNNARGSFLIPGPLDEPLFLAPGQTSEYAGQPVGLIVATSFGAAQRAAAAVAVTYGPAPEHGPLLDLDACRAAGAFFPLPLLLQMPAGESAGGMSVVQTNTDKEKLAVSGCLGIP